MRTRRPVPCARCGVDVIRIPSDHKKHCAACGRVVAGITRRGRPPVHITHPYAKVAWLEVMKSKAHRNKMKLLCTGRKKVTPATKKNSALHARASHFMAIAPNGVIHQIDNVSKFVLENRTLFNPLDVVNKARHPDSSYQSNATQGLSGVGRGYRMSWKGWMYSTVKSS